jgi:hypothetical protein
MFWTDLLSIIGSLNAVYAATGIRHVDCSLADSQHNWHNEYLILCIQCQDTPYDGQRTCPKHVEYFTK